MKGKICSNCCYWERCTETVHWWPGEIGGHEEVEKQSGYFGSCNKILEERPFDRKQKEQKKDDDKIFVWTHEVSCTCMTGQNFGCIHFEEKK